MSLDRLQSKQGVLALNAEPNFTVAASLSSVASNQYRGGYQLGDVINILPATNTVGGGGQVLGMAQTFNPPQVTTNVSTAAYSWSASTGARINHSNAGVFVIAASAGGLSGLIPPNYHGQMLTILNVGGSGSFVSTVSTASLYGAQSTTSGTFAAVVNTTTIAASGGRVFMGCHAVAGTASSNTTCVWHPIL